MKTLREMMDLVESAQADVAEGLTEMDKSAPQPGRDGKVSHSTYGSRDKKGSDYFKGKEAPGKPVAAKQMSKDALDILKKHDVAEAKSDDPDYDETLKRFKKGLPPKKKQGVAEEQVEESTPDAMAKIDDLFRK